MVLPLGVVGNVGNHHPEQRNRWSPSHRPQDAQPEKHRDRRGSSPEYPCGGDGGHRTPAMKTVFLLKRSASGLEKMIPTICTKLPTTKERLKATAAALEPSGLIKSPKE